MATANGFAVGAILGVALTSTVAHADALSPRAHPNIRIVLPAGHLALGDSAPSGNYETPASLACVYGITVGVPGCNPQTLTTVATGGSKVIAIVDPYDDPNAASDLAAYSQQFGLPAVTQRNFKVVYASGKQPRQDPSGEWELQEALEIEMAHALAPNAKVVLVEATSNTNSNLLAAESVAAKLVSKAGGGEVSNSWSAAEYATEETTEKDFSRSGVVFLAAAGDTAGVNWPSVLSNVVAVGGTSINRRQNGDYVFQSTWSDTGGGASTYVPRPGYQDSISKIVGSQRGLPDISTVANPQSGVWVYDSLPYEGNVLDWVVVGGTSVSVSAAAAMINNAGHFLGSTPLELAQIYAAKRKAHAFTDIVRGNCGANGQITQAAKGWDFCSGVGAPFGTADK